MENKEKQCDSFDAQGIIPYPGESMDDFLIRARREASGMAAHQFLRTEPFFRDSVPIPQSILKEGAAVTERLYGFSALHVPGCFLKKGFGLLWGGCTLSDEHGTSVFALRNDFRNRKRWFLYNRSELLAHEQCHAARTPLNDHVHEEFFAYQTSGSRLRRYLGNCFRSKADSVLFLLGLLPLFAAEGGMIAGLLPLDFPLTPFLLIALLIPAFSMIRNQFARNLFFRAEKNLKLAGIRRPLPVLFRADADEIKKTAACRNTAAVHKLIENFAETELRWQIALRRFR